MIDRDTIKLLRIPFSFFLLPIFLLATSQMLPLLDVTKYFIIFFIIHFLVYPASNGYNSYIDQDEGSIGGLEKPPKPTKKLFHLTLMLDSLALLLACIFVNPLFSLMICLYITASRAYSSKVIRLKKYPIAGFLTVTFFQGAFTYAMVYAGLYNELINFQSYDKYILLACSFQIAGAYPLTQIYQHEADLKDGVTTLSYKLGYIGTFVFTMVMFLICNIFYFLYFYHKQSMNEFYLIQAFFIPIVSYFAYWFYKVVQDRSNANFKNTMMMNLISSVCMNTCFILLIMLNNQ